MELILAQLISEPHVLRPLQVVILRPDMLLMRELILGQLMRHVGVVELRHGHLLLLPGRDLLGHRILSLDYGR